MDFKEYSAAFHDRQDSLMHYGIRGMRWGIRRYQNEDGSLTPLGKKRYAEEEDLINFHYEAYTNKVNKILNKINKKLSKDPNNKKLHNKKKIAEKEKEVYKKLAKAEIEKMYKSSYKDLLKKKDKVKSNNILTTLAFGTSIAGLLLEEFDENNNWNILSKKERTKIIDDVMKESNKLNKNRVYYNSNRYPYSFKPYRRKQR